MRKKDFDVYSQTNLSLRNPDMGLGDAFRPRRASAGVPTEDDLILKALFQPAPRPRSASSQQRIRLASAGAIPRGFVRVANTNKLIRVSDQDFWELKRSGDGGYELRRLVDDEGNPIEEG